MFTTFPGLYQMLPTTEKFNALDLYVTSLLCGHNRGRDRDRKHPGEGQTGTTILGPKADD